MGSSSSREKKVVILGGGYAGIAIAKKLDKNFDVVVIDAKDFFFHSVGAPRTLVNERFGSLITIPYTNLLRFGRVVHEWATNIDVNGNKVITSNGEHFYDYLVIATGSTALFPAKFPLGRTVNKEEVVSALTGAFRAIQSAKSVLIVGGGPVGVEVAGEIKEEYGNDVGVTLVHNRSTLLPDHLQLELKERIQTGLKQMGVSILLDDGIQVDCDYSRTTLITEPKEWTTKSGKTINADVTIVAVGAQINSEAYATSPLLSGKMNERGKLNVNQYLQVDGIENVFAVGDCALTEEWDLAFYAEKQALHCADNIKRLNANKALRPYNPHGAAMFVTLGPRAGAAQVPTGKVMGPFLARIKGKDFFTSKTWGTLGQRIPN